LDDELGNEELDRKNPDGCTDPGRALEDWAGREEEISVAHLNSVRNKSPNAWRLKAERVDRGHRIEIGNKTISKL
jgi:hypothetical protein